MRFAHASVAGIAALFLSAQAPVVPLDADAAFASLRAGHYLSAIEAMKNAAFAPDGSVRNRIARQYWEQFSPTITDELPLDAPGRGGGDAPELRWTARMQDATPRDAIAEIVRRAADTNIVVLNEAHQSPRDRAFALEVARALRPLSYSVLAAETIDNADPGAPSPTPVERLRRDGFARLSTGAYTLDPVFAGFLREAMAMGYAPVAYESHVEDREQGEADNLMADDLQGSSRRKGADLCRVQPRYRGTDPRWRRQEGMDGDAAEADDGDRPADDRPDLRHRSRR